MLTIGERVANSIRGDVYATAREIENLTSWVVQDSDAEVDIGALVSKTADLQKLVTDYARLRNGRATISVVYDPA